MANSRSFNSALINASKVKIIKCLKSDVAQTVDSVLSEIAKNGGKPYYVYGDKYGQGNEKTAVKAYYNAFFDILAQCEEQRLSFDYIFLATGTGMTQSGLLAGLYESRLFLSQKVIGISVARSGVQAKDVIRRNCSLFFGIDFPEELVYVDDTHLAGGYGKYGLPVEDAISEAWQKDGVPLDTCYTGKAFCGMLDFIIKNNIREKSILFLHTGGLPIFFDYIREKKQ